MRKYYLDNLRILCVLLLFPFHTAMIYNNFGEHWYIHGKEMLPTSLFIFATYPWWMSILFAIAGISAAYTLRKRSAREYLKNRTLKLLVPCLSGLVLIIPIQTYLADCFYNGYTGTYLEHMKVFFTLTDFSGYDGHFTPAHTWFMLYLFLISLVTLPLLLWYNKRKKLLNPDKITIPKLLPLFFVITLSALILDIGGKSFGEYTACFLIGFFLLNPDEVQERLKKNAFPLTILWLVLMVMRCAMRYYENIWDPTWPMRKELFVRLMDIQHRMYGWSGILALLGLGGRYLDFNSAFTKYFSKASFPIYFFHQSVIVVVGYFIVGRIPFTPLEYVVVMLLSFGATILCYELTRRWCVTRFLFGIK